MLAYFATAYEYIKPHLQNVPLHYSLEGSVVAMVMIIYLSKFLHAGLSFMLLRKYDNIQASYRYGNKVTGATWEERTVQRAYSAHQNHWEAFILFAAAIILSLVTKAGDRDELTRLANAFLYVRLIYNFVYILAFNTPLSALRSSVWTVGVVILFRIFAIAVEDIKYQA